MLTFHDLHERTIIPNSAFFLILLNMNITAKFPEDLHPCSHLDLGQGYSCSKILHPVWAYNFSGARGQNWFLGNFREGWVEFLSYLGSGAPFSAFHEGCPCLSCCFRRGGVKKPNPLYRPHWLHYLLRSITEMNRTAWPPLINHLNHPKIFCNLWK